MHYLSRVYRWQMFSKFVLRSLKSWVQSEKIAELSDVKHIERKCNQKSEGLEFNSCQLKTTRLFQWPNYFTSFKTKKDENFFFWKYWTLLHSTSKHQPVL